MYAINVTVGRNVTTIVHNLDGTESRRQDAMPEARWSRYVQKVEFALGFLPIQETATRYGTGEWDGVPEESAQVTALAEERPDDRKLDIFRHDLRRLAEEFQQEAIAWSISESHLIVPTVSLLPHFYPTGHPAIQWREGVTA